MTGMKEGAGEDPYAGEDDIAESEQETETDTTPVPEHNTSTDNAGVSGAETASTSSRRTDQQQMQIPYKFRRDGVQDGRDRVPLFVQEDTKRAERDTLRELEARFDDNVSLTDLREALVKVGLQHPDEVAAHLEEWGYGMTFSE